MRYAVAMCLLLLAVEARADWGDGDITDIINNVKTITGRVTSDVPVTVADLKRQLDMLQTQGVFITEVVPELLDYLMHRRTPLLDFLGTPSGPSCEDGSGSPCDEFRGQLIDFFTN